MNKPPNGHTCTVICFPHQRENTFILCLLLVIIRYVDIQLCDEHGHLQCVLLLFHHTFQVACTDVVHVVRLISVSVDGCSSIAQRLDQSNVVVYIMLERVIVIIDED